MSRKPSEAGFGLTRAKCRQGRKPMSSEPQHVISNSHRYLAGITLVYSRTSLAAEAPTKEYIPSLRRSQDHCEQ